MTLASPPKLPGKKNTGPNCPYPQLSPVGSKFGFTSNGMLTAHCHQRASHSPRLTPPHSASGGKISSPSTATSDPGSSLVSATAALLDGPPDAVVSPDASSGGAVVASANETPTTATLPTHRPAASTVRERIRNMAPPISRPWVSPIA